MKFIAAKQRGYKFSINMHGVKLFLLCSFLAANILRLQFATVSACWYKTMLVCA